MPHSEDRAATAAPRLFDQAKPRRVARKPCHHSTLPPPQGLKSGLPETRQTVADIELNTAVLDEKRREGDAFGMPAIGDDVADVRPRDGHCTRDARIEHRRRGNSSDPQSSASRHSGRNWEKPVRILVALAIQG
jgi:hypothetical protein